MNTNANRENRHHDNSRDLLLFRDCEIKPRISKDRFVTSAVLHGALVLALLKLGGLFGSAKVESVRESRVTPLFAPDVPSAPVHKKIRPPSPQVMAKLQIPKPEVIASKTLVQPKIKTQEIVKDVLPPVVQTKKDLPVVSEVKPVIPKRIVTDSFAAGSSAPVTLKQPVQTVQTGGFGDPQGVKGTSDKGQLHAAALGSFDLPAGQGQGNGTGGTKGAKGTVASSGFGDGVAGPGQGDHGGRKGQQVAQAGFQQVSVTPVASKTKQDTKGDIKPVEILFKPRPVYTDEARKLHVEGEVLMQVTFSAAGRLEDMRVVRGLGHGLDEAAQRAAAQIRFKPALRDGQPFDSTAIVHIVFEMAE